MFGSPERQSRRHPVTTEPANDVKLERLNWKQFQERLAATRTSSTPWSTPGPRPAAPARRISRTWWRCTGSTPARDWPSISLSLDDPTDKAAVAEAEKFLKEKKAVFTNVLLDENFGDGFEKLNINAIPAVFVYGPDGKEVKRFTMDDPNNQFTYDEVEKAVTGLLDSKNRVGERRSESLCSSRNP